MSFLLIYLWMFFLLARVSVKHLRGAATPGHLKWMKYRFEAGTFLNLLQLLLDHSPCVYLCTYTLRIGASSKSLQFLRLNISKSYLPMEQSPSDIGIAMQ